jgi:hypothetical protein
VKDPAYAPDLEYLYGMLREQPDTEYRASMLPMRRTKAGEYKLALPGGLLDMARGAVDLMAGPQTGVMTPEATGALAALPAAGSAPAGALGTFAGRRSATAPLDMLQKAEGMAAKGADERAIWKDTGWFKGADDQWRHEIDDTVSFLEHPETAPPGYEKLQHMDVQDAYPKMWEGLSQSIKTNPNAKSGRFEDDTIFAEGPTGKDRQSVALHELQHAVQKQEGFAKGGSSDALKADIEQAKLAREALNWRREMATLPKGMDSHAKHNAVVEQYRQMDAMDWLPSTEARDLANQPFDDSVLEKMSAILGDQVDVKPRDAYQRLAGEAEARAVQKRMDYTPEQRREVFPFDDYDVPRDKLIVRGQGGMLNEPQMSADLPMDQASRMARAREMGFDTENVLYHGNPPADATATLNLGTFRGKTFLV